MLLVRYAITVGTWYSTEFICNIYICHFFSVLNLVIFSTIGASFKLKAWALWSWGKKIAKKTSTLFDTEFVFLWPLSLLVHPEFAALHDKVAAETTAPVQPLSQAVVGAVPSAVLHDSQRQPRKYSVLSVGARHCLILGWMKKKKKKWMNTTEKPKLLATKKPRENMCWPLRVSFPNGLVQFLSLLGSPAPSPPGWGN